MSGAAHLLRFGVQTRSRETMAKRKGFSLAWAVVRGGEMINVAMNRKLARDIASLTDGARVVRATVKHG